MGNWIHWIQRRRTYTYPPGISHHRNPYQGNTRWFQCLDKLKLRTPQLMLKEQPFYFRTSMILFMLVLIGFILFVGADIIVPFAFAVLLSILLIPITSFLERRGLGRINAITISILLAVLFIGGVLYFLSSQILSFMDDVPVMRKRIAELILMVQKELQSRFGISIREQKSYLSSATASGT